MIVVKQFEWINELEWTKWQIGIIASTSSLLKSQNRGTLMHHGIEQK